MSEKRFDPVRVRHWRRTIFREFTGMGFRPGRELGAATILAAISGFGTDAGVLSEVTGFGEEFIAKVVKHVRKAGILRGQTLRTGGWDKQGGIGYVAVMLDAMVAAGDLYRPVDPKRSAAQKARAVGSRHTRSVRAALRPAPGAIWTPKQTSGNPWYDLAERQKKPTEQSR